MDYLYHGANTIDEYRQQIREINKVLENGKLTLRNLILNDPILLSDIDES